MPQSANPPSTVNRQPSTALIFAAGLGTRLRPLTNDRPKALVEVGGKTLLAQVVEKLRAQSVRKVVVNVHHFADKVEAYLADRENFGIEIHVSDERDLLLDTGGGLKKARRFLDTGTPFIVHNTDILSDIDLQKMYAKCIETDAVAVLATRDRETSRYLLFDEKQNLRGWKNVKTGAIKAVAGKEFKEETLHPLAFSGISVLHPRIFDMLPDEDVFSVIPVLLEAAAVEKVIAYPHDDDYWLDVGKLPAIEKAEDYLKSKIGKSNI